MANVTLQDVQRATQGISGVKKLVARNSGGTIEIHGEAPDFATKQAAFQEVMKKVGNAPGIINAIEVVQANAAQPQPAQARPAAMSMQPPPAGAAQQSSSAASGARTHVVKKGETLSHIAQQFYGKASAYQKIFEANRDQLDDPDRIREGMTLKIPT